MLVNGVNAVSEIASANRTKSVTERIYHIEKLINLIENNMVQVRLARDLHSEFDLSLILHLIV